MAPMGPGTYGSQKGRPKKKKRQSDMMKQSFPTPPRQKKKRTSEARTGSFQMRNETRATGGSAAKAMRQATLDLLKKKKKK